MHDNCHAESSGAAADGRRLAMNALSAFPRQAGAGSTADRISAVAELCRSVDGALDALVVRTVAEAAEEGWSTGRIRAADAGYHARLQRALSGAALGAGRPAADQCPQG